MVVPGIRIGRSSDLVAKSDTTRTAKSGFSLNEHKTAIIVGILSLFGILGTAVFSGVSGVVVAAISNSDKLRGDQTQAVALGTEDALAYNEQRRALVENAYDQMAEKLVEGGGVASGDDAKVINDLMKTVRQDKAAVQKHYAKLLEAIKNKKQVQADIAKTELNTTISTTQREYDRKRHSLLMPNLLPDIGIPMGNNHKCPAKDCSWRPEVVGV